jgi:hypothetical protein
MGRVLVLLPVAREERHPSPADLAERDRAGWGAEGGFDGAFLDAL